MTYRNRAVFAFGAFVIAVAAACGGGGGGSVPAVPAAGSSAPARPAAPMTISLTFPSGAAAASAVHPQFIPAGSLAIEMFVYAAGATPPASATFIGDLAVPPTNGAPQICTVSGDAKVCNITVNAPLGNDLVVVQLFDSEPNCTPACTSISPSAVLLAGGEAAPDIIANATNAVSLTLPVPFVNPASQLSPVAPWTPPPVVPATTSAITGGAIQFSLPAGSVPQNAQISVAPVIAPPLPLPTDDTFVYGLDVSLAGIAQLTNPIALAGTFDVTTADQSDNLARRLRPLAADPGATLGVSYFNGLTYVDVGSLPFTFSGNVLTFGNGSTGITQTGLYVVSIPAASGFPTPTPAPAPPGTGGVVIVFPSPSPVLCEPAPVLVNVGQTVTITCTSADTAGPFTIAVANPSIATAQQFNAVNLNIFNVTGVAPGTTTLSLQTIPGGTGSDTIVVSP